MLDKNVLISCIFIGLALIIYFFYWNRLLALAAGLLIRIWCCNMEGSRTWIDIGSIHFSLLAGRILLRDIRYHSGNQTVKIVKGQIQWRYWIRRPTARKGMSSPVGEDSNPPFRPSSCRIQLSIQGFEWFLYNRTAAYDSIISQMERMDDLSRSETRSTDRRKFTGHFSHADSTNPINTSRTRHFLRILSSIKSTWSLIKNQLPHIDSMDVFPIGIEGVKGLIFLGNPSTPYSLVSEFQRAEGTYGYASAKSKLDPYRTLLTLGFHHASIKFVENEAYVDPMATMGQLAHDCIAQYAPPQQSLRPRSFVKFWRQLKLSTFMDRYMLSQRGLGREHPGAHKGGETRADDSTPIGADFSQLEYAKDTKFLEARFIDVSYYCDNPGQVPADVEIGSKNSNGHFNVGNGDTDPEWGIDIIIYRGIIKYGPWADRQRGDLQGIFFPSSWQNVESTPRLQPGDQRLWTTSQILVELKDNTTLQIPFREASKDWQWDGKCDIPSRPRNREPALLQVTAGDCSARFTIPMVADHNGYESTLEIHLDDIIVTSSLNDIRLVQSEACRIRCEMPSPLQWNSERTWHISITLRDPVLHLIRDHINMFADLGKDWTSGPPHDYRRFIPVIYVIDFDMHQYNLNLYLNDNNIIDRPHVKEENVLFTTSASHIKSRVTVPSNIFRPDRTTVSFTVEAPDTTFVLSLPRWNTNALYTPKGGNTLGKARSIQLDGSYLYFSQVQEDNIEQLCLKLTSRDVVYKALGWSIRYFMVLKDNYFGSFTHFSTLYEFLRGREEGLPFGDPIMLSYRPGKANMLQVTMTLDVNNSHIVLPIGLPGYESVSDWDMAGGHGIGPCLVLCVPELQMQLRLHDHFMEMSLNIDIISGGIDFNYPEHLRTSKGRATNIKDLVLIDRIDISAYRLFGPQPRTVTYVCIWEIQLGLVRTVLAASDARILAAAGDAFRLNSVDIFNAPSSEFLPRNEPDVTFYKVSVKEIDATWRADRAAFSVVMPLGLKIDTNDLGSYYHQKVTSIRIPSIVLKLLITGRQERSLWLEAAAFETRVSADIYSAPRQHISHTGRQVAFILEQDQPSGRAHRMFGQYLRPANGNQISKEHSHLNGVFLPQPTVPDLARRSRSNKIPKPFRKAPYASAEKLAETSDSDAETGISEAERDARLALARSVTPLPQTIVEEETMTSGDESDDADLTDGTSSDSVWSDQGSSDTTRVEETLLMCYFHICRHYKLRRGGQETIWEGTPFILVKVREIVFSHSHSRDLSQNKNTHPEPSREGDSPRRGIVSNTFESDDDCDVTTLHVQFSRSELRLTPLLVPVMVFLEEDTEQRLLGPELWIDSLMVKHIGEFLNSSRLPARFNWRIEVTSVILQIVQHIPMTDESHPLISFDADKGQLPSKLDNMATLDVRIGDFATSGTTKGGVSACRFALGFLSVNLQTTVDKAAVLSSLPGESSFAFILMSSNLSFDHTSVDAELGLIKFSIGQRSPEFILAAALGIVHNVKRVITIIKRSREFVDITQRVMVYNILSFSRDIPIVEPLSTIQPSYLVQRGVPSSLRADARFKFLFHLRDCLWNLKQEERASIRIVTFKCDADWRKELETRLRALDPDIPVSSIETLFCALEGRPVQDMRQSEPYSLVSVRSGGIALDIVQPSGKPAGQFYLSEMRSILRLASYDVVRVAPAKNMSQTSLRSDKRLLAQKTHISFVLGDTTLVLLPHVMTFFQHVVRLRPSVSDEACPQISTSKMQPRFINIEMTVFLNLLHVQAAAENLVVEIGLSHVRAVSSSLSRFQEHEDQSTNNTVFVGSSYIRARSPQMEQVDGQDILAALEVANGKMNLVTRQEPRSRMKARLVFCFGDLQLNVPRSALRLYRFIEEWRGDYLPGLENTINSLLSEMKSANRAPSSMSNPFQRPAIIHMHGKVNHLGVALQVMHGTWVSLDVHNSVGYLVSANLTSLSSAYTFGLQISSMTLSVSAKPSMHVKMALPPFTITGRYDGLSVHILALVDLIDLNLKPVHWDKLLVVQQKFGQDFNDLLLLMQEASAKRTTSKLQTLVHKETQLKYGGYLKIKGFRIGLEGTASTLYLECQDIGGGLDSGAGNAWHIALSNLALSLASRNVEQRKSAFNRRQRSAFVIIDFKISTENKSSQSSLDIERRLRVLVTKIHAVLQASSISAMNDFLDELQIEVLSRKKQRSLELAAFKEKTRSILRTFEIHTSDTSFEKTAWLDVYTVDIIVQNIGVAFPLTHDSDVQIPEKRMQDTTAVRAFLFSIAKIGFGTHRGETGQAVVTNLSFQFVRRFRQFVPSDFLGENHQTRNRLLYPEMNAHVHSSQSPDLRRVWMWAVVNGFILDLDSTIPDYIFSALDIYRQRRENVERLSAAVPRPQWSPTHSPLLNVRAGESTSVTSGIFASLRFSSGKIRLFNEHGSSMTRSLSKDTPDEQLLRLGVEVFSLPEVSVWTEYRATPSQGIIPSEPPTLIFKSAVHSSENILRPTLLHFLTEVIKSVEDRLRKAGHGPPSRQIVLPANLGLRISFSLRIDRSRLELTCLPDVNVMAGLHWENGGFVVNVFPATQKVTFTGTIGGLTAGLKHGFLSEDCVKLDARNLAFTVTFGRLSNLPSQSSSHLSVVLDTEFLGGVRFSRLQDVLCFKAVWLDNIPILNSQLTAPSRPANATGMSSNKPSTQGMTTAILVRVRRIKADIDLGQSISTVTLDLCDAVLRTRLSESLHELSIFVGTLGLKAKGNMAGHIDVQDCVFQTSRRMGDHYLSQGRMLDLRMTSGPVSADLHSEHQKLLRYRYVQLSIMNGGDADSRRFSAEPLAIEIYDHWSRLSSVDQDGEQPLQLVFTVASPEILAIVTVGAVPKLMTYAHRFKANLDTQREGASRESAVFNRTRTPKVDNPLSTVAEAMIQSAKSRLKQAESTLMYLIQQHMSFHLDRLQLVVFPRTMEDVELASFIAETVRARLNRLVASRDSPAQRDLHLSFSSLGISRYAQLSHSSASKDPPPPQCHEWLWILLNGASEATIVGLPAMGMRMTSEEASGPSRHLTYDFNSEFKHGGGRKQEPEDIFITLNVSLYSWLTLLRKNLTREMEQVRITAERQPSAKAGSLLPKSSLKRASESPMPPPSYTLPLVEKISLSSPESPLPPPIPTAGSKEGGQSEIIYTPRSRRIERLKMRQLGEATPDVMHPFFMKKSGFNLEESLPQYVHEYATIPLEEIMEVLLKLYSRQLSIGTKTRP
ncbi:hypothetical protein AX15_002787 [Amanita polypyramis BW_CC]|nr:hypothetical protein AX15_002787 [Amanita polypyramis BW_CC]